jgi:hypothetical protein
MNPFEKSFEIDSEDVQSSSFVLDYLGVNLSPRIEVNGYPLLYP